MAKRWSIAIEGDEQAGEASIELFARNYGWTGEVLTNPTLSESAENPMIPNPVTSFEFGARIMQKFMQDGAFEQVQKDGADYAKNQAQQVLDSLTFSFSLEDI